MQAVVETAIPGLNLRRGKVRDVYDLGEQLLIVATDRISAFDCILPTPIPGKGKILTDFCRFWFKKTAALCGNHIVTFEVDEYPQELKPYRDILRGRSMLVKKAKRIDIECVVRGYLAGSGWKSYQKSGSIGGQMLPKGLVQADKLPAPLFTPTSKADVGHDEDMSFAQVENTIGKQLAKSIQDLSFKLYNFAHEFAGSRGYILADTKFEFGTLGHNVILIDEVLTPDSSRYWERATYNAGQPQYDFDKQFVRDYLEKQPWNKTPPAPALPDDVVQQTLKRYEQALRGLTQ